MCLNAGGTLQVEPRLSGLRRVAKPALSGLLALLLLICGVISVSRALHQLLHNDTTGSHHLCLICSFAKGQVSVGEDVGSSLSVSSAKLNFSGGAEATAEANAFEAVRLQSTYGFDPNSTDPWQNAMKLYVDLGNVLTGLPGPAAAAAVKRICLIFIVAPPDKDSDHRY